MATKQVIFVGTLTTPDDPSVGYPTFPTNPIAPGGPPPMVGGGPVFPPGIWPSPGFPSHPIAPGGGPSQGPGFPTHPIAPGGGPSQGPGFPGQLPSPGGGAGESSSQWEWAYSPMYGWVLVPASGGGKPQPPGGSDGGRPSHPIAPGGSGGTPTNPIAPGGERPSHPISGGGPEVNPQKK